MAVIHTFRSLARSAVVSLAVALVPACASQGATTCLSAACEGGASANTLTSTVPLEIANHGVLDIVVYAYRYGAKYRLGDVVAQATTTLKLPLTLTDAGSAQLFVHRIGEGRGGFLTNIVHVSLGDRPTLYVERDDDMSSLAVFPDRH